MGMVVVVIVMVVMSVMVIVALVRVETVAVKMMVVIAITGTVARPQQLATAGDQKTRPKGTRPVSNWSAIKFFKTALKDR